MKLVQSENSYKVRILVAKNVLVQNEFVHFEESDLDSNLATIGKLDRNSWYLIDGLRDKHAYYLFIDANGKGSGSTIEYCPYGSGCGDGAW